MRRVAWGALPCMCLKYRKSSPRWAIDLGNDLFKMDLSGFFSDFFDIHLSSGICANSWLYFSCNKKSVKVHRLSIIMSN